MSRIEYSENCFLNYEEQADEIILELVQVDPARQGEGIGNKLMTKLFELFENDGRPITLYAEQQAGDKGMSNEQLIEWYESLGFVPDLENGGMPFMVR